MKETIIAAYTDLIEAKKAINLMESDANVTEAIVKICEAQKKLVKIAKDHGFLKALRVEEKKYLPW